MGTKLKEKKRVHIDKVQWYTSKRSESEASKIDRNRELPNPFRFTSLSLSRGLSVSLFIALFRIIA